MSDLIDTAGIAELLGTSRKHVTDRVTKQPDFPPPVVNRSQRLRRWAREQVMQWAASGQSRAAMSSADSR